MVAQHPEVKPATFDPRQPEPVVRVPDAAPLVTPQVAAVLIRILTRQSASSHVVSQG